MGDSGRWRLGAAGVSWDPTVGVFYTKLKRWKINKSKSIRRWIEISPPVLFVREDKLTNKYRLEWKVRKEETFSKVDTTRDQNLFRIPILQLV